MTFRSTIERTIPLAIIALVWGGCSIIRSPARTEWTTFALELSEAERSAGEQTIEGRRDAPASSVGPSIRVAAIESAGEYDTPQMAYSKGSGEIEYFARHRWAETPGRMLAADVVTALDRSGRFAAVVAPSSQANADFLVETELLAFRQEFMSAASFHVTLRATLVNALDGRVRGAARTFDIVEPMEDASPVAGAKAAERAVARLVAEVAWFCAETLAK